MNLADFYEWMAIERYFHVTVMAAPEDYDAVVGRIGKDSSRHEVVKHSWLPAGQVVLMRTHKLDASLRMPFQMDPLL